MSWAVGQELKPLEKPPITREQLQAYSDASGDTNPIHLREDFAKAAGMPSVIAHGMISMAFLGDCVVANFPEAQYRMTRFRSRFKKITFPGDRLTCEGRVKAVSESGEIHVTLWTKNQDGQTTTEGEARLLPL